MTMLEAPVTQSSAAMELLREETDIKDFLARILGGVIVKDWNALNVDVALSDTPREIIGGFMKVIVEVVDETGCQSSILEVNDDTPCFSEAIRKTLGERAIANEQQGIKQLRTIHPGNCMQGYTFPPSEPSA